MAIVKHRGGARCAANRATKANRKRNLLASRRSLFSFDQIVDPMQGVERDRKRRRGPESYQDGLSWFNMSRGSDPLLHSA